MISVTRLNGIQFFINAELIESIESAPDTVITFSGGKTLVVKESPMRVVTKIVRYKRRIFGLCKRPVDRKRQLK